MEEFQDEKEGLGRLKECEVILHIDNTVKPITKPHRRVSINMCGKVEKKIQGLGDQDIIEKV